VIKASTGDFVDVPGYSLGLRYSWPTGGSYVIP